MLTLNEFLELREKLENNEVSIEFVKKKLQLHWDKLKDGKRSWQTKDWKERRDKFIKEKCEICGSSETLTVQHLSHPRKYNKIKNEIIRSYKNQSSNNNNEIDKKLFLNHVLNDYKYEAKPLCPKNKLHTPKVRVRKKPKYRCQDCKYEFEVANFMTASELVSIFFNDEDAYELRDKCFISKDKWRNKHNLSNIKYWFLRKIVEEKNRESIEKSTLIVTIDEEIKYLSFQDAITTCKTCAYSYDLKAMELCQKCMQYYKGIQYESCIQCLPKDKREAAIQQIEFGKQMREMEKRLGID